MKQIPMNKKFLLLFTLLFFCFSLSAQETIESIEKKQSPKLDMDFKVYLPSTFGIVSGNNPLLGSREESSDISCINLLIESRFSIATVKKVTFAWSFASGGYVETKQNSAPPRAKQGFFLVMGRVYFYILYIKSLSSSNTVNHTLNGNQLLTLDTI